MTTTDKLKRNAMKESIINFSQIAKVFADELPEMQSKTRKREIVDVRFMAINMLYEHTNYSLRKIGEYFGGRDHSTVLNAVRKHNNYCDTDPSYRAEYRKRYDKVMAQSKVKDIAPKFQGLFNFFVQKYGLNFSESEMREIINECAKI